MRYIFIAAGGLRLAAGQIFVAERFRAYAPYSANPAVAYEMEKQGGYGNAVQPAAVEYTRPPGWKRCPLRQHSCANLARQLIQHINQPADAHQVLRYYLIVEPSLI